MIQDMKYQRRSNMSRLPIFMALPTKLFLNYILQYERFDNRMRDPVLMCSKNAYFWGGGGF